MIVAIDGPAGAGKSTVARAAARALGFTYLDSGAMYRAVGAGAARAGRRGVGAGARSSSIELGDRVLADGRDVTEAIRTPEVSEAASRVATNQKVRAALVEKQRELLWPTATGWPRAATSAPSWRRTPPVKVFLTAEPRRARPPPGRRSWAPTSRPCCATRRCATPRTRAASTRRCGGADDAVELDTTGLSVDEVVERIADLVHARGA